MITHLVITALLGALSALFSLLPSFTLPSPTNTGAGLSEVVTFNRIFPIQTLMQIFVLCMTLELLMKAWDLTVYIYHQFWGSD